MASVKQSRVNKAVPYMYKNEEKVGGERPSLFHRKPMLSRSLVTFVIRGLTLPVIRSGGALLRWQHTCVSSVVGV